MAHNINVGIVWPQRGRDGRSFIEAHTQLLPLKTKLFYSSWEPSFIDYFPQFYGTRSIFSKFDNMRQKLISKLFRVSLEHLKADSLAHLFAKEKIDVVIAEFGPTGTCIMHSCEKSGIPLVVHFHGADAYSQQFLEGYGQRYKTLFRIAQAIIVVSQDMRQQLEKLGAPAGKIHYNPCGVDTAFFVGARPQDALPVFLSVARFVEKKGHFFTLLAFKKLLEHCPQAQLVLVGGGPLREACVLLSQALKITASVNFTDILAPSGVLEWMRKARALVQHSICACDGDSEGMPISILEAGSCGLPVVATKHKGISEAVIHDKTGFLVNEGDIEAMAEYMLRLAKTPELAVELGENARGWIMKNYSQEKSIKTLYQILVNASRQAQI